MSAYQDVVTAHLAFLADTGGDNEDTGNAVRTAPTAATFTLTRAGHREHELLQEDGGAYGQAGEMVRGFVAAGQGVTLAVADLVTFEARPWRVFAVVPVSGPGNEVLSQEVTLLGLEG